jgi:hypothetical protein
MIKKLWQNLFKNPTSSMGVMFLLSIAGIAALSYLGGLNSWGFYVLFLLCPVGHILMTWGMSSRRENGIEKQRIEQSDSTTIH